MKDEAGWCNDMSLAPKDKVIDVWLGDADQSDVDFYCTPRSRRAPAWFWIQGKWRPLQGLPAMTVFVQPTHWRLPPEAPTSPQQPPPTKPTDHASTSPGPVNCNIRKRFQGEGYPRTCGRCGLTGPCPFFENDGRSKLGPKP